MTDFACMQAVIHMLSFPFPYCECFGRQYYSASISSCQNILLLGVTLPVVCIIMQKCSLSAVMFYDLGMVSQNIYLLLGQYGWMPTIELIARKT